MAIASVMTMTTQSCVNDFDDDCNKSPLQGEVKVRFTLKLDNMEHSMSRAGGVWNPSGPTEAGSTFDNAIRMNDEKTKWLHVMLIHDDGTLLHLDLDKSFQFNPNEWGYDMTATLDLSSDADREKWLPGTNCRVMVLANFRDKEKEHDIISKKTIDQLESQIKEAVIEWYTDKTSPMSRNSGNIPNIPMWGMTTAKLKLDGYSTEQFTVQLLRSVAKVKIELTERLKIAGYKLVDCSVDNCNKKVYQLPAGWKDASTTIDNVQAKYDAAFREKASRQENNLVITAPGFNNEADDDESLVFYLPEWDAKASKKTSTITLWVLDDLGEKKSCSMTIDNDPDGKDNSAFYSGHINNVNRNHLYKFIVDKDIAEGELTYKLECWNHVTSAIGWNPPSWSFDAKGNDSEALYGYVSYPSYSSDDSVEPIEDGTSFADYTFQLKEPEGAVWKAFLVEDGVEYPGDTTITVCGRAANTPSGFFFGVGNDNKTNTKSASTGIARDAAYNVKVGTRFNTVDFINGKPEMINDSIMKLNAAAQEWKDRGEVPTCYLVIKIALDGKNFSEVLKINPAKPGKFTNDLKFAGTETHIQIRNLFHVFSEQSKGTKTSIKKKNENDEEYTIYYGGGNDNLVIGIYNIDPGPFKDHVWWGYPMGHKDIPKPKPETPTDPDENGNETETPTDPDETETNP